MDVATVDIPGELFALQEERQVLLIHCIEEKLCVWCPDKALLLGVTKSLAIHMATCCLSGWRRACAAVTACRLP